MLNPVELLLLKIKDRLLLEHLFPLFLQPLACLLDLLSKYFEFKFIAVEVKLSLLQLFLVCLDELILLFEESLLAPQLVLVVSQLLLTVFDFDLLRLDVTDVIFSLFLLQFCLFLL